MEEFLKDNYHIIIFCLSVISILLFIVVLVNQLYIKKEMSEEIKRLKGKIGDLNNLYNKTMCSYQKQGSVQRQFVQQQNGYQQGGNQTAYRNQQQTVRENTTTNNSNVSHVNKEESISGMHVETTQTSSTHSYMYLQEANAGKFLNLMSSPEKCYFRTWEEGGARKYEFCGNVAKALANINAIFDDVCEIEGKRSGATDIENVSAGTLDSELRITRQAKIRLK